MLTTRASGTCSSAPEAALASGAGALRRMAVLNHHRADREGRRRAQDRADVVRVGHLVEHQHRPRPAFRLCRAAAGRREIHRRQRRGLQHHALVHGAVREQGGDVLAGDDLRRLDEAARGERKGTGVDPPGELRHAFLRRDQAVAAAVRIGERGGHRMGAVEALAARPGVGALLLVRAPACGRPLAQASRSVA